MRIRGREGLAIAVLCTVGCVPANAGPTSALKDAQATAHKAPASRYTPSFTPLAQWKAAILAGDKSALQALYSTAQGTITRTPQGDASDPTEEPTYWSNFHAAGLTDFDPKVLERKTPQPGAVELVLRVYLTMQANGESHDYVVAVDQAWAEQDGNWQIVATQRSDPAPRPMLRLPEPAIPNTTLYPDPAVAQREIKVALAEASTDHKNVLLVFGGNWCFDCHVLDAAFRSKDIAPIVKANYHVVHINIAAYDQNLDLADRYEVPLKRGVPELAVLDSKGKLLTSSKQAEFESVVKLSPADVTQFLEKWKPAHAN